MTLPFVKRRRRRVRRCLRESCERQAHGFRTPQSSPPDRLNARQLPAAPEPQTVYRQLAGTLALLVDLGGVQHDLDFVQDGVPGFSVGASGKIRMDIAPDDF